MALTANMTLGELLRRHTKEGELYERRADGSVVCYACGHRCLIRPGRDGICRVRFNVEGTLYVPWGYAAGIQLDPIEKKPFFHAYPGAKAMSFGMLGCDYHCSYCQNWVSSQALRDSIAGVQPTQVSPEEFVRAAKRGGAKVVTSTYNEPLITSEWAVEVFKVAKREGLIGSYVSNGNGTPEVLDYIRPYVDLYKIDLKGFNDKNYRKLGGMLENVLNTVKMVHERGFWLEIVTLVIPGFNSSDEELRDIAQFIAAVSPDIPWHVTAFHKDYKMTDPDNTSAQQLVRAAEIGYSEGLRYVYAGNLPGRVGDYENTYCPNCKGLLIERWGYQIMQNNITNGGCHKCGAATPGRWE